ncbi:hypothetical protein EPR50_G00146540 [Perca flavescens]|uniref:Uncharacterized protein n=1 Tax=Perca flavescens TaxID=8167 RepID=A0A484CKH6_PERFV|nr:hypothetical protein EPR50_G00146540 [Perca flavescens]
MCEEPVHRSDCRDRSPVCRRLESSECGHAAAQSREKSEENIFATSRTAAKIIISYPDISYTQVSAATVI